MIYFARKFNIRSMKLFLVILCVPLLILTSCNTDDNQGPSTPAPMLDCNGDIDGTALVDICGTCVGGNTGLPPCVTVFKAFSVDQNGQTFAWSLPIASATINSLEIEIIAINTTTNEKMVISLPNDGVGQYFSQNTDATSVTTYIIGQDTLISVYPSINVFTLVTITEIDSVAKTMTGTFEAGVYDPMDSSFHFMFENGEFENVPYTE